MTKDDWRKREAQWKRFHEWEEQQEQRSRRTPQEAWQAFDQLYQFARAHGAFDTPRDPTACEAALRVAVMANRRVRGD